MKKTITRLLCVAMASALLLGNGLNVSAEGLKDIFDAEYYAEQYPDLKAAFGNNEKALYQHFLTHGIKEGRVMNPIIDIVKYREQYEDLQAAFGNNWDSYVNHYFIFGVNEHRENGTDFDLLSYLNAYDDIKAVYGNNYAAVAKHYAELGINEGRTAASKEWIEARETEEEEEADTSDTDAIPDVDTTPGTDEAPDVDTTPGTDETPDTDTTPDTDEIPDVDATPDTDETPDTDTTVDTDTAKDYEKTINHEDGSWTVELYDGSSDMLIKSTKYDSTGNVTEYTTYAYDVNHTLREKITYYSEAPGKSTIKRELLYNEFGETTRSYIYLSKDRDYTNVYITAEGDILSHVSYDIEYEYDTKNPSRMLKKHITYILGADFRKGEEHYEYEYNDAGELSKQVFYYKDRNDRTETVYAADGSTVETDYDTDGSKVITSYNAAGKEVSVEKFDSAGNKVG